MQWKGKHTLARHPAHLEASRRDWCSDSAPPMSTWEPMAHHTAASSCVRVEEHHCATPLSSHCMSWPAKGSAHSSSTRESDGSRASTGWSSKRTSEGSSHWGTAEELLLATEICKGEITWRILCTAAAGPSKQASKLGTNL